jgi:hypothetical protein
MDEVFEWKAEIAFKGTADQFAQFRERMESVADLEYVAIRIPDWWPKPRPLPGFWPIDPFVYLGRDRLAKLIDNSPIIDFKYIRDIRGGIRTAHLHVGDRIALVDQAAFKEVVSQVAAGLAAQRFDATGMHR